MNADDLKKRTKQFALRVLKLVAALPNSVPGRAIGGPLVRSGTSVGANYQVACRGRSRAEFVAKLGVVEEEADESAFWMEMIIEGELLKRELVGANRFNITHAAKLLGLTFRTLQYRLEKFGIKRNRQSAIGNRQ